MKEGIPSTVHLDIWCFRKKEFFEVDFVAAVAPSVRSDFIYPELMYQTIENVILGGSCCYC